MTYSLIEKEATIYEQQIDELFNLTELDAKRASKGWEDNPAAPEFLDYKGDLQKTIKYKGRDLTQYQLAVAKDAEASSHWSDVYKRPKSVKPMSHGLDTITPDTITHEPVVAPPTQAEIDAAQKALTGPVAAQVVKRVIYPRDHHPDGKFKKPPADSKKKPSKVVGNDPEPKKKPSKVVVNDPEPKKNPLTRPNPHSPGKPGVFANPDAQKATEKFMADEEIKRKAAERKAAKAKLAEEQRKIKELEKKIAAETELKKKNALETELKKQLAAADDLELKAKKERIAREVKLQETAKAKAEVRRLELAEQRLNREGKPNEAKKLLKQKQTATTNLSRLKQEALKAGVSPAEIQSAQVDNDGNLRYQDVVPKPVKTNAIEISKERLSNAQKYASKTQQAATVAQDRFTQLQKSGTATSAELASASKEFKRTSLEALNANTQHELMKANNAGVAQSTKAKAELTRLETKIVDIEGKLRVAQADNKPGRVSTFTKQLENTKLEQKIALDAQQSLKDAKIKKVPSLSVKIQPNDTLGKIAKRYGVSVDDLVKANGITNKNLIIAGEDLKIPIKGNNAFAPGALFSPSQQKNILTTRQQNSVNPGEKVWIDQNGDIRSSTNINDPKATNLSNLHEPEKLSTGPEVPTVKSKTTNIGVISDKEAKRMKFPKGSKLKILKNGRVQLLRPGGMASFISRKDAEIIARSMGKPLPVGLTVIRKGASTAGGLLKGMVRLSTGAVLGFGVKGEIISTIAMTSAMMYGSSRMLRNIEAEQTRMEAMSPGNALSQLSPAQYLGGVGNQGRWHDATQDQMWGKGKEDTGGIWSSDKMIAELLSHDDVITRTLENTTPKNLKDLKDSFKKMTKQDADVIRKTFTKDGKINAEFLEDHVVTVMDEAGVLQRVNAWGLGEPGEDGQDNWHNNKGIEGLGIPGKNKMTPLQMMTLIVQPGAVVQIIPTHRRDDAGIRTELKKDERTTKMKTIYLDGEFTGEFTDIQHYVSDKIERGGRIVIEGEEKYIPTMRELDMFLLNQIESGIPSDWYLGYRNPRNMYGLPEEKWNALSTEEQEKVKKGSWRMRNRPTTPEGWLDRQEMERSSKGKVVRPDTYKFAGPDMTDQEKITWWQKYRKEHNINPPNGLVGKEKWKGDWNIWGLGRDNWLDKASDMVGKLPTIVGLDPWWKRGAATDKHSDLTYANLGKLPDEILDQFYDKNGNFKTGADLQRLKKIMVDKKITRKPPPEGVDTTLNFGPVYRMVNGKRVPGISKDEDEIVNFVASKQGNWKKPTSVGAMGYPTNVENYNRLMKHLATKYNLDIRLLKTLAHTESGMKITSNKLSNWAHRGDTHLGKEGSFGVFHVRWGHYKPGAVNAYNKAHGKNYSWKDIAGNPLLSADIGAWFYAKLLKDTKGNHTTAYGIYNGGEGWFEYKQAQKNAKTFGNNFKNYYMNESIKYIQKSAILEGIAKAA